MDDQVLKGLIALCLLVPAAGPSEVVQAQMATVGIRIVERAGVGVWLSLGCFWTPRFWVGAQDPSDSDRFGLLGVQGLLQKLNLNPMKLE